MLKKTITGVYGGSFNPIHLGHTGMASEIVGQGLVDEMWLIVSPQNPLKDNGLWDDALRLELAQIATASLESIIVSDVEFSMPKPNYMIKTLQTLSARHPDREFVLVIGMDNWECFQRWYMWEEILKQYRIIVLPRQSDDDNESVQHAPTTDAKGVTFVNTQLINLSSTWIRSQIESNPSYDGEGLDPLVWEQIKKKKR
ncbi:MAG: nicotinate (nicotinamide) nucleotide adenylyltransferase [Bacteroidaceae bacterium]|nr:nicotinate (nicotinamide) nucleotide adenylyltransferase [Bacteroidaceae bacterium]